MNEMNPPESEFWTERRSGTFDCDRFRTPWERDHARVVHSASFRRLQGKTQIFGTGEHDFYRTRLTHSLEVSQIGVSITRKLRRGLEEKCPNGFERKWLPDPMLMGTVCLAHDLGHPPFGHGGEVALNRCMLHHGGFEGNGQTLRVITRLDNCTRAYGMDLTRRAVLGTIKYPARHRDVVNESTYPKNSDLEQVSLIGNRDLSFDSVFAAQGFKPPKCYLDDEHVEIVRGWVAASEPLKNDLDRILQCANRMDGGHTKTKHRSLDASIMDLADDIAYGVHDLEDAIALKLMDRHAFEEWFNDCDVFGKHLDPLLRKHYCGNVRALAKRLFGSPHDRKLAIGQIVDFFVNAAEVKSVDADGFRCPLFRYGVELEEENQTALKALMGIVTKLVTKRLEVQQLEFKGQKIVTELFHAFTIDHERLLEPGERRRIERGEDKERVICDYIAGMTDNYAITRFRQLFVPRAGSVFDKL